MGEIINRSDDTDANDPQTIEQMLQTVKQDLRVLQQDLVANLSQDINRLQAERSRLLNDIEKLQAQQQMLQSQHQILLTQQQLAQQRLWAKQLAQALASHLYGLLSKQMGQPGQAVPDTTGLPLPGHESSQAALQQVGVLDSALAQALGSLQQDLSSYQSSLSKQLNRMQNLEQQGEALLEALVSRLSQKLQAESARLPMEPTSGALGTGQPVENGHIPPSSSAVSPTLPSPAAPATTQQFAAVAAPAPRPNPAGVRTVVSSGAMSSYQMGLIFILCSTLALSLHNVVVGIIGNRTSLFGIFNLGQAITLDSFGDSLLILWLRMLVVVPIMIFIAKALYPPVWRDVKMFFLSRDRRLMWTVIFSGSFLFGSQVFIYLAIAATSPGVAVTILFMYPLLTVPLAWFLFSDRPTLLRVGVMFAILLGVVLTAFPRLTATTNISPGGVMAAILSGGLFALYLVSMQISFRKLHPVPVSFIQFVTIFILTNIMLLPFGVQEPPKNLGGLILGGIVLGSLTLVGYLLNNLGVQRMGAARASIIASSGPALTALLAFVITPGNRTALQGIQILGILIVTLAVIALSFEKLLMQNRAKATK